MVGYDVLLLLLLDCDVYEYKAVVEKEDLMNERIKTKKKKNQNYYYVFKSLAAIIVIKWIIIIVNLAN